jgi:hypothetical protein
MWERRGKRNGLPGREGPAQGVGKREQARLLGFVASSSFFFFPFSFLYSNYSNKTI